MIGLKGGRVIVVEDDEKDALPILRALARKGIPAIYFNGSSTEVPKEDERLVGVRLAILDMDVVGGGATHKSFLATLGNLLKNILREDNGPYVIIAWTQHKDLVDNFDTLIFSTPELPKPIIIVTIEKAECKEDGEFNFTMVSEKLEEALGNFSPLMFLEAWEEKCFEAATEVTNALSGLATPQANGPEPWRKDWKSQLLQLMHALAKAETGSTPVDGDTAISALYYSLIPLHADRIEYKNEDISVAVHTKSSEILSEEAARECDVTRIAKINAMLHLAFSPMNKFQAGNVYPYPQDNPLPVEYPRPYDIVDDFLVPKFDKKEWIENMPEVLKRSIPVLVEVSPICDHVQKNIRIARLIAGLVIPAEIAKEKKTIKYRGDFIWRFGPIYLETELVSVGEYFLLLSTRHLISFNLDQAKQLKPLMRLRSQAFGNLQASLWHHATRPGILLLPG